MELTPPATAVPFATVDHEPSEQVAPVKTPVALDMDIVLPIVTAIRSALLANDTKAARAYLQEIPHATLRAELSHSIADLEWENALKASAASTFEWGWKVGEKRE